MLTTQNLWSKIDIHHSRKISRVIHASFRPLWTSGSVLFCTSPSVVASPMQKGRNLWEPLAFEQNKAVKRSFSYVLSPAADSKWDRRDVFNKLRYLMPASSALYTFWRWMPSSVILFFKPMQNNSAAWLPSDESSFLVLDSWIPCRFRNEHTQPLLACKIDAK